MELSALLNRSEPEIAVDDFFKVEIRVGTIREARPNPKARKPSYILKIDFGESIGTKTSSAQLVDNYNAEDLVGRQILAVMNFPVRMVAGVQSEVLVLAAVCSVRGTTLIQPSHPVADGARVA